MFEQERALRPFKPAMDVLMEDTHFGTIYDADQLARNEVPLQAAVYFDDMYVDSGLQLDTLSRVGRSHYWTTNEFEHDGVHGSTVFKHLVQRSVEPRRFGGVVLTIVQQRRASIAKERNMANPTIGFIGYGNMAQAIAEGLVNAGVVNGGDIVACAAHYDKLERNAAKLGRKSGAYRRASRRSS